MNSRLKASGLWRAIGGLLLASVIVVSLVQIEQPLAVSGIDKFEHALAYGILMYWWGMVHPGRLAGWALFLPLLGLGLELAQLRMPGRFMEWRDALANLVGVLLACLILQTRAAELLTWFDRQLFDRRDPGGS